MLNIKSQTSTENMTFDFDKVDVQNDWLMPLINTENINNTFNYFKMMSSSKEDYEIHVISESQKAHIFYVPWRDSFVVGVTFIFKNDKIISAFCSFPREGLIYVLNYFLLVEEMNNDLNLKYMLRRSDIDFGWFHINNGFAYEVTHLDREVISLYVIPTNKTGRGFTRDKSGKVLFITVD